MTDEANQRRHPAAALDTGDIGPGTPLAVSPDHRASQAAVDIMRAGGNAVDGAIAANAMLGVVAPDTCGVGGDLFALVHRPGDSTPLALNSSGRAGSGTSAAMLRASGLDAIPARSPWAITLPGCIDGWSSLHGRLGALPLAHVLEPAITVADDGFVVSPELAESLSVIEPLIRSQRSALPLYPDGKPPGAGEAIRRARLATVLRDVVSHGRDAFYGGEVGAAITGATGGVITPEDLAAPQADWIDPLGLDLFGLRAWTIPPNSQGYITLAAGWIIEHLDWSRDPDDPLFVHSVIEAYRAAAWDRDELATDPDTAPLAPDELLSADRLLARASALRPDAKTNWAEPGWAPGGTAYMCALDSDGMGVSLIQSNYQGIGSGLSAGDTGVFLHNRGSGFTLREGHPNEYTPGRRPLHTLSPTLWTRDDALALLLGTRGGQYQPQLLAQIAAGLLWAGETLPATQTRPRWQVRGWRPTETPEVVLETGTGGRIVEGLRARGHSVTVTQSPMRGWGPVSMITAGSEWRGAADPRTSTAAAIA